MIAFTLVISNSICEVHLGSSYHDDIGESHELAPNGLNTCNDTGFLERSDNQAGDRGKLLIGITVRNSRADCGVERRPRP
jgi:hypothetical protein